MIPAEKISEDIWKKASPSQAENLKRFFKTEAGQYGEGDRFAGVKVPEVREIVKHHKGGATLEDVELLTRSTYHEERLAGLFLLIELYKRTKKGGDVKELGNLVDYYLKISPRCNNWDLVDLSAPKILGDYISDNPERESMLMQLSSSNNLWKQRISIVATLPLIKKNNFDLPLDIIFSLKNHPHDLIQKATGWMLREIGKKNRETLKIFLDRHCTQLQPTTLRYAIEHFDSETREYYRQRRKAGTRVSIPQSEGKQIPMSHRLTISKKKK